MEDQERKGLKHFLKHLGRYGTHGKVVKLYGKETQPSDIIVGEIHSMADTAEKTNRKPLVTVLREVYPDGSKGKLFSLFACNKYVHMLKSNVTATGSIIGICGADIDRCPIIDTNDDDHLPYRARLGLPKKKGSKFIFMVNCHSKENETLPKMQRMNKAKETLVSSQTNQNLSQSSQITSKEGPNTSVAAAGASNSKPEPSTSKTGLKISELGKDLTPSAPSTSKALPSKSLSTSSVTPSASTTPTKDIPERRQTQRPIKTINRYQYLKLCDLKMAATKLNMYGVINRLLRKQHNYAHLDLVDETLSADQTFKLHVFKGSVPSLPNIKEGHIIRAHRLKTEEFQEQWDGRVFDARDIVIFPPKGNGKEGAETVSKKFHFDDTDLERLTELRQWIKKEYSNWPLFPTPTSREDSVSGEEQHIDGGYNSSVKTLAEIQSEGHYILYCKVVESHHKKGKIALLVTDGTIPSDLITREKAHSTDNGDRSAEVSRTVEVILKSETQMKLQDKFVKIGVEAEVIVDAYSEKTCLAFVLWKTQNIKIIPPTHSRAKLINRCLQQMKKDANCPVSTRITGTSKRVPNDQEVESDSNSRSGHDVSGSKNLSQNRKRRINSQSQESENNELDRNMEKRKRVAESTGMQQRRRSLSSEDLSEIKQQHRWHDRQGHFHVTPSGTAASRDNISKTEVSVFNTSTPVKNCDEPDIEEDGKCEDILLNNSPAKKNVPTNTQGCRPEHVDCTRRSAVLSTEDKQSFPSNNCKILYSSKQLQKAPLVPRVNSKDGAELLKTLKQKARRRVYGDNRANLDHSLNHSNDTIYDNGIQTVPNKMQNEESQAHECLECNDLDSAEMMGNMHQRLSRVARVKPVTKDKENSQMKTSTDLEYAEEVQQSENSEEQSPTETEHDHNFGVVNLDAMLSVSEQGDNRSAGDITLIADDPEISPVGPSSYRGDLRERVSQFQASNNNVDSGTSDDEDSGTSSACTYVSQNKSVLGKKVAESCSGGDVDRHCKYSKTSPENCIDRVQNVNDSDDQELTLSESNASITGRWTEVQDSPDENPMPVSIRCIKSKGIEENEYLVEGVITQIEPPIRAGNSRKDFVTGYCSACNTFSRYSSLIWESNSQKRTCPHCPEGRRQVVLLLFALRFHIVDKTNEELVVGLCGKSGMDFFGVTVNRYLRDPQIRRQVADALLDLLPANEVQREPRKVRLHIQSFLDLSGIQYMIKKTYLCFTHGRE